MPRLLADPGVPLSDGCVDFDDLTILALGFAGDAP